jgi:hypothetical protein
MKRFVCIALSMMLLLLFAGCATVGKSEEERKQTYDMRKDVGVKAFVGSSSADWNADWRSP